MSVNERECEAAGVDPKAIASISRRIQRAAIEAEALGLQIFGGTVGSIRSTSAGDRTDRQLVLATMDGNWSGGDGAAWKGEDGLMRGEGS